MSTFLRAVRRVVRAIPRGTTQTAGARVLGCALLPPGCL